MEDEGSKEDMTLWWKVMMMKVVLVMMKVVVVVRLLVTECVVACMSLLACVVIGLGMAVFLAGYARQGIFLSPSCKGMPARVGRLQVQWCGMAQHFLIGTVPLRCWAAGIGWWPWQEGQEMAGYGGVRALQGVVGLM